MPSEYSLSDLSKLSGVSPRTVRYYIQSGLLPAPAGAGPAARYSDAHLDRLRVIRRLQSSHLPLAEIRRRLEAIPDERIASAAKQIAEEPPADSALDYISSLLGGAPSPASAIPVAPRAMALPPAPSGPPPESPTTASTEPERAQWERIALDPDIEIHVRRPLSRLQNKRVERLISIARQLLEED